MAHITYSTSKPTQWNRQQLKRCFLFIQYVDTLANFFCIRLHTSLLGPNAHMHAITLSTSHSIKAIHATNCPSFVIVGHIVHLWSRFVWIVYSALGQWECQTFYFFLFSAFDWNDSCAFVCCCMLLLGLIKSCQWKISSVTHMTFDRWLCSQHWMPHKMWCL